MSASNNTFGSIGALLDALKRVSKGKMATWFRGQAEVDWKLQPSIMRPPHTFSDEVVLLKKFKQNAVPLLDSVPTGEAEWLFLMQHHGVPTRLLDWTESPLVALYFAIAPSDDVKREAKDAALWCLFPHALNELVGFRLDSEHDIPSFGHEDALDGYLPSRAAGIASASPKPVAVIAARPFRRLHVQQGVFTLFHRNPTPIEEIADANGKRPHIVKLVIPASAKKKLRSELALLQIDRLALFPELENVAGRIKIHRP